MKKLNKMKRTIIRKTIAWIVIIMAVGIAVSLPYFAEPEKYPDIVEHFSLDKTETILKIIFIISMFSIAIYLNGKYRKGKGTVRRGWNEQQKRKVRNRQNGRCASCNDTPPRWEYHHIDGNRSNNDMSNCEGLCPNCHSVETHEK